MPHSRSPEDISARNDLSQYVGGAKDPSADLLPILNETQALLMMSLMLQRLPVCSTNIELRSLDRRRQ